MRAVKRTQGEQTRAESRNLVDANMRNVEGDNTEVVSATVCGNIGLDRDSFDFQELLLQKIAMVIRMQKKQYKLTFTFASESAKRILIRFLNAFIDGVE